MSIALGIDTGGTYTDAVLVDQETGEILATAKALTTHRDLSIGIEAAIRGVLDPAAGLEDAGAGSRAAAEISLVGLSTTLATNAIVEGQGGSVCLLLLGYDAELIEKHAFAEDLVTQDVVHIDGGHNIDGEECAPLDEEAVRAAILARRDTVDAFAVSGYFSVRNPAHELRVKALIEELTADGEETSQRRPPSVTCGHELTTKLNAIRRATTAALNARLVPTLRDLILTVRAMLDAAGVKAPLMIVKGDGSLVRSDWAVQRPIETILSGPASSVVGAWYVAGREDVWVVDVGGTTTDIAALRGGHPRINPRGAQVGRWRTMVEATDVHTVGLGGDSHVRLSVNGEDPQSALGAQARARFPLTVGPQRVLPLCRLSSDGETGRDQLLEELAMQQHVKKRPLLPFVGQFLIPRRRPGAGVTGADRALLDRLHDGPLSLVRLAQDPAYHSFLTDRVERLVAQQLVMRVGFTPTDALHVLGRFVIWDEEAARLGAALLAAQVGLEIEAFCERVIEAVSTRVAMELVTKVLGDEVSVANWQSEPVATGLLARALGLVQETDLACRLTLRQPVVAVGAPVSAYMPGTAAHLHTDLVLPPHADVANAIGAVVGSVVQRAHVLIRPIDFGALYRVHLPGNLGVAEGLRDFPTLEESVAYAEAVVPERLRALAEDAGARQVEIQLVRTDHTGPVHEKIDEAIFLETLLSFTAVGRPAAGVADDRPG